MCLRIRGVIPLSSKELRVLTMLQRCFTVFLDFFGRYLNNITQFEGIGFLFLFVECKADARSDFF